ncbi:MAG: hypothetical protein KDA89_06995 [Planctomycetaceae bacterium]|nr:hypothetical protein [Planctomycetaceae bacterium]
MRRILLGLTLVVSASLHIGCSGGGTSAPSPESPSPEITTDSELKERLQFIAESGGTGSALAGVKELCEKAGKASLVSDAEKLERTDNPEAAKKIAQGMLEKL